VTRPYPAGIRTAAAAGRSVDRTPSRVDHRARMKKLTLAPVVVAGPATSPGLHELP
jgi:hypothetical protein